VTAYRLLALPAALVLLAIACTELAGARAGRPPPPVNGKIAFVSDRDLNLEVYVINPDGSAERRLTRTGDNTHPVWSPDGRKIAFASVRYPIPRSRIFVMNAGGGAVHELTAQDDFWPSWSPDGREIAFATLRHRDRSTSSAAENSEIYVMDADGSDQRRLTLNDARDAFPAWSSRGGRIAFVSRRDGNDEIYVMNADGSAERRLTRNGASDFAPAWAPDGRRLGFVRNGDIFVMDLRGRARRLTKTTRARETGPAWSPDGRWMTFARALRPEREGGDIWVMRADGRRQRRLTNTPAPGNFEPNWGRRRSRTR
jgi:Tol biopolymer transport system component